MKWDSFESHLLSSNYDLYHTKQFADVTLVSDDLVTFPAHKIVLSTSSKIFKSLLAISTNDQHPFRGIIIVLKKSFYPKMTRCFGSLFILKIHIFNCQF